MALFLLPESAGVSLESLCFVPPERDPEERLRRETPERDSGEGQTHVTNNIRSGSRGTPEGLRKRTSEGDDLWVAPAAWTPDCRVRQEAWEFSDHALVVGRVDGLAALGGRRADLGLVNPLDGR